MYHFVGYEYNRSFSFERFSETGIYRFGSILLNKSLARILIRCPTLNEHEPFYLM